MVQFVLQKRSIVMSDYFDRSTLAWAIVQRNIQFCDGYCDVLQIFSPGVDKEKIWSACFSQLASVVRSSPPHCPQTCFQSEADTKTTMSDFMSSKMVPELNTLLYLVKLFKFGDRFCQNISQYYCASRCYLIKR